MSEDKYTWVEWKNEITLPDGYEFQDENGNVINAQKIVLEKKKPKCPENLIECRQILDRFSDEDVNWYGMQGYRFELLEKLQLLLVCRDAYWMIAGDWKPDYDSGVDKFGIFCYDGVIQFSDAVRHWDRHKNKILDFPTKEMRDIFYENFKDLIEECKELL